jgi:hypothetical protein
LHRSPAGTGRQWFTAVLSVFALNVTNPAFAIETRVCFVAKIREVSNLGIRKWRSGVFLCVADVLRKANKVFLCHASTSATNLLADVLWSA